ncbi:MAG: heavy metal-responsive transcriptional regulator [Alkalispirochaeta sp.]
MRIGRLADRCGVTADTIRYYEARGLLPKPNRTEAGYRDYGGGTVQKVRFIKNAQQIGFGLAEVGDLFALKLTPGSTCGEIHERAVGKLRDVDERIRKLKAMRSR